MPQETADHRQNQETDEPEAAVRESLHEFSEALAARIMADVSVVEPPFETWPSADPLLADGNIGLYTADFGTLAILRPFGVSVCALHVAEPPTVALLAALQASLLCQPSFLRTQLGVHPERFLIEQAEARNLCCLYVCTETLPFETVYPLFHTLLQVLPVRAFYRAAQGTAFLFCADAVALSALLERIQPCLLAAGVRAGYCGPYERAVSAQGCLEKARRAARAPRQTLQSFGECRYTEFWLEAARIAKAQGYAARDFCHETLWRIRAYDLAEGTSYAPSLRAYLDSSRSLREAADRLGVHRNTMAYRMRRIGELFCFNINDDDLCFELQFSFRILEYLEVSAECDEPDFFAPLAENALWDALHGERVTASFALRLLLADVSEANDAKRFALVRRVMAACPACAIAFDDETLLLALPLDESSMTDAVGPLRAEGLRLLLSQAFSVSRMPEQLGLMKLFLRYTRALGEPAGLIDARRFCATIFYLFLQQHIDLLPFCCDEVIRIMDYDYAHGANLSPALYAYLTHYANLKDAAQEARLHRNTLDYQIKKALSLLGDTPVDGPLRFEMMCGYRILSTAWRTN